jgi:hypothetical protein
MTGHAVTFLPSPGQEMKQLGDSYARAEFKAHKSAKVGQVCALHVEKGIFDMACMQRLLCFNFCRLAAVLFIASFGIFSFSLSPAASSLYHGWHGSMRIDAGQPASCTIHQVKQFAAQWKEYVVTLEIQVRFPHPQLNNNLVEPYILDRSWLK